LLKFLADCLKDDPNMLFRESVVDTIIEICPSAREQALLILAEHIEDCMQSQIQTKILNFLAIEGPKSKNPASYIRFIYNRVNLEKAVIRAAAVSALASFAFHVQSLNESIVLLIEKCLNDSDDEVRERAHFYYTMLSQQGPQKEAKDFFELNEQIDVAALEDFVLQNRDTLCDEADDKFEIDISSMKQKVQPKRIQPQDPAAAETPQPQKAAQAAPQQQQIAASVGNKADEFQDALMEVNALKQFTETGLVYKTSRQNLNDVQTAEYAVQTVKYVYKPCVIVQYGVKNTLDDQVLSKMTVKVNGFQAEDLKVAGVVGLPDEECIKAGETKYLYIVL
jgi:coatomer protein complex subunit gamma